MSKYVLLLVCVSIPQISFAQESHFYAFGKYDLRYRPYEGPEEAQKDFLEAYYDRDLGGIIKKAASGVKGNAKAGASFTTKFEGGSFSFDYLAKAEGYYEIEAESYAAAVVNLAGYASWQDRMKLQGEYSVPYGYVLANYKFDGHFTTIFADHNARVDVKLRVTGRAGTEFDVRYIRTPNSNVGPDSIDTNVSLYVPLNPDASMNREFVEFKTRLDYSGSVTSATLGINFLQTFKLDSITFPDGTTPESHGYEIVFESGILSPNLGLEFSPGDADLNGIVDVRDLIRWQDGFGITEDAIRLDGDADQDGDVDGHDFLGWQRQFGNDLLNPVSAATEIPEPSTILLLLAAVAGVLRWRRSDESEGIPKLVGCD